MEAAVETIEFEMSQKCVGHNVKKKGGEGIRMVIQFNCMHSAIIATYRWEKCITFDRVFNSCIVPKIS